MNIQPFFQAAIDVTSPYNARRLSELQRRVEQIIDTNTPFSTLCSEITSLYKDDSLEARFSKLSVEQALPAAIRTLFLRKNLSHDPAIFYLLCQHPNCSNEKKEAIFQAAQKIDHFLLDTFFDGSDTLFLQLDPVKETFTQPKQFLQKALNISDTDTLEQNLWKDFLAGDDSPLTLSNGLRITRLALAVLIGDTKLLASMVVATNKVDEIDSLCYTASHFAAICNNFDALYFLHVQRADFDMRNILGGSVYDLIAARRSGHSRDALLTLWYDKEKKSTAKDKTALIRKFLTDPAAAFIDRPIAIENNMLITTRAIVTSELLFEYSASIAATVTEQDVYAVKLPHNLYLLPENRPLIQQGPPNCTFEVVYTNGKMRLLVIALCEIDKGSCITFNYGPSITDSKLNNTNIDHFIEKTCKFSAFQVSLEKNSLFNNVWDLTTIYFIDNSEKVLKTPIRDYSKTQRELLLLRITYTQKMLEYLRDYPEKLKNKVPEKQFQAVMKWFSSR